MPAGRWNGSLALSPLRPFCKISIEPSALTVPSHVSEPGWPWCPRSPCKVPFATFATNLYCQPGKPFSVLAQTREPIHTPSNRRTSGACVAVPGALVDGRAASCGGVAPGAVAGADGEDVGSGGVLATGDATVGVAAGAFERSGAVGGAGTGAGDGIVGGAGEAVPGVGSLDA